MSTKFERQARFLIRLLVGCALILGLVATYLSLTVEYVTKPGYKTVIVDSGFLDELLHSNGVLEPGTTRVSKDARTVPVIDGYKEAGIGPILPIHAQDGIPVSLNFSYAFKVEDPKLLIDRFTQHWQLDHLWNLIEAQIVELASEHPASYFKDAENVDLIGKQLDEKVQKALVEQGMPVTIKSFTLGIQNRGGSYIRGRSYPGKGSIYDSRDRLKLFPSRCC